MAVYSKIPKKVKKSCKPHAVSGYVIFVKSLSFAIEVASVLRKQDVSKGIPAVGYITISGVKFYYCRYGYFNDRDIYSK